MHKPLLIFAALSILAAAGPNLGVAAPAAGSTEESDRQFLTHLEASDSAPSNATETAPSAVPKAASPRSNDKSSQAKPSAPSKKTAVVAKAPNPIRRLPPGEVADDEMTPPVAASPVPITVVQSRDRDRDRDRDEDHRFFHRLFSRLLNKQAED